ncbi:hypothetical protein ALP85_101816 [Pseudomonas syringae pv. syringae]|nr:hypothetical protein ALP85_101816 [Pseudomonas syringae pv. syringae]
MISSILAVISLVAADMVPAAELCCRLLSATSWQPLLS